MWSLLYGSLRVAQGSNSKLSREQGGSLMVFNDLALKFYGISAQSKVEEDTSPFAFKGWGWLKEKPLTPGSFQVTLDTSLSIGGRLCLPRAAATLLVI